MKNIWKIFQRDMMRIRKNVIALVVIVGISVVPCLYAWFNIAASWDPYSNTGKLKVAVASVDEGYEGSLIPLEINIGDQVLSALRENTQMEWVFTTKDKATAGVKSGKYYAAIVIPKDFSNKMMSVFSENVEKPEITYYSNAKENAINVGSTKMGKYRFNVFCISLLLLIPFYMIFRVLQTRGPWYHHRPLCLQLYKMDNDSE